MVESRKRATASLKVKYKSATLGQFTQQFGLDISRGGIFIKTKSPLEPGVLIRLELQLSDATPVIQGSGRVTWRRMPAVDATVLPAGMGIEFIRLEPASRELVDRIVDEREGRPSRFEQTDGAEHISGSQPLTPASFSSSPPPVAESLPPVLPSPTPSKPPVQVPNPPPPNRSGLFESSGLRAGNTMVPAPEAPMQSSFFANPHNSNQRFAAVRVTPAPAPPQPSRARAVPEDEITTPFLDPQPVGQEELAATQLLEDAAAESATTAPLNAPEPTPERVTSVELPDESPLWNPPVAPVPNLGLSSLHPPPRSRSTTVIWAIVVVLALAGTALAFFYLKRSPAHSQVEGSALIRH